MSYPSIKRVAIPPEQQAIRDKCVHPLRTFVEFPIEAVETSIPARFEKIVQLYPGRLAIKDGHRTLTYQDLNQLANRVARAILLECSETRRPVALLFGQDWMAIVAILGALKAGKFYLPLVSSLPLSRNKDILFDSTARLLITDTEHLATAHNLIADECDLINIDEIAPDLPTNDLEQSHTPDDLAYIVYTSGSTGRPKGVTHNHRHALYHVFDYGESFHVSVHDRVSLLPPWGFNGGAQIIFSTLLHGAALFPVDVQAGGIKNLARLLVDEEITIHHSSGALLRQVVSLVEPVEKFQNLRLLRFGGDVVTAADIALCRNNFSGDCLMVNSLSATETGIISRCFFDKEMPIIDQKVPVGFAAHGIEIQILDDAGNPLGTDEIGEIAVRSRFFSPGYWRRPDLTAAKFLPSSSGGDERICLTGDLGWMTADGCLYHRGRKDFQVKIRGYRLELAEVEAVLLEHAAVKQAVVAARNDRQGSAQLVAYVIAVGKLIPGVGELQDFARQKLPDYMIPTAFVFLDALPMTPTGKIDRRLLPEPANFKPRVATPYVAPRTSVESELTRIWAEVLAVDPVGIHDNFFELGGHSLAAMRVVSRVIQSNQLDLPLRSLLDAPTVADMARVIVENAAKRASESDLERILSAIEAMSEHEAQSLLPPKKP
jgi:amino acid adenylation domain-containing protein